MQVLQNQKVPELMDNNCVNQITQSIMIKRTECINKIIEEQQEQEFQNQGQIYYTSIADLITDLICDNTSFQFVESQYQQDKQIFEKEFKILNLLKGQNITQDKFQVTKDSFKDSYQFKQVTGKTNLQLLKQKTKENYIFDVFYLILLEKLNRMHEKGVAHSNIKPSNIVISYDNEPFFIDFGSSIYLSDENDYEKYLNYFTPQFNLRMYFEQYNPIRNEYTPKKFQSKEEIKLCDQSQLCLSFLYLLCENQNQINLFNSKNYNQLIQNLIDYIKDEMLSFIDQNVNSEDFYFRNDYFKKNRMIVLSLISEILNQADSQINKIQQNYNESIFTIDYEYLQQKLVKANDIVSQGYIYNVQCIDKFSILLINFLDTSNFYLKIDPKNTFITPLPKMKEYENISKKYKINEYFENLLNSRYEQLDDYDFINIFEYFNAYQIQKYKIQVKDQKQLKLIFKLTSNSKSLNAIIIQFDYFHVNIFQRYLNQYQSQLYAQKFEIFQDKVNCLVAKNSTLNQKLPQVSVKYHLPIKNFPFKECFKTIKNNNQIKQIEFSYKCNYDFTSEVDNKERDIKSFLQYLIKQMNKQYIYPLRIQLERSFNSKINSTNLVSQEKVKNQLLQNLHCEKHEILFKDDLNNFIKQIIQQPQQQHDQICSQCQQNIQKIKQYLRLQVEQLTSEIFKMNYTQQRIRIKIFDYNIELVDMWLQIQNFIETQNNNCQIQLILINCNIREQVADIIKKIGNNFIVNVSFKDYIKLNENEYDYLKYEIFIEQNQEQQIQQAFEIIFIKEVILNRQETNQNEIESQQIIKQVKQSIESQNNENKYPYESSNEQFQIYEFENSSVSQAIDKQINQYLKQNQQIQIGQKHQSNVCQPQSILQSSHNQINYLEEEEVKKLFFEQDIKYKKVVEELQKEKFGREKDKVNYETQKKIFEQEMNKKLTQKEQELQEVIIKLNKMEEQLDREKQQKEKIIIEQQNDINSQLIQNIQELTEQNQLLSKEKNELFQKFSELNEKHKESITQKKQYYEPQKQENKIPKIILKAQQLKQQNKIKNEQTKYDDSHFSEEENYLKLQNSDLNYPTPTSHNPQTKDKETIYNNNSIQNQNINLFNLNWNNNTNQNQNSNTNLNQSNNYQNQTINYQIQILSQNCEQIQKSKQEYLSSFDRNIEDEESRDSLINQEKYLKNKNLISPENSTQQGQLCKCNKVLIVDDKIFNIINLQKLLQNKCDTAYSGEQAIACIQEKAKQNCCKEYKIIFMDTEMPLQSGIKTTREIRKDFSNLKETKIIGCSACYNSEEYQNSIDAGMNGYITKPFDRNVVEKILEDYL